jgi:HSP20 family protein
MSVTRWEPFRDMDEFFNRLMPAMNRRWGELGAMERQFQWSPSADISETDAEFRIRAELPGVKKDDVKVTVDNGVITIAGERIQEKDDKGEKFHRTERFHGSFARSFSLPDNADAHNIKAESKDGTLTVRIPKLAAAKPKQVQVQVE